jgi:hypothetical protein
MTVARFFHLFISLKKISTTFDLIGSFVGEKKDELTVLL